MANGFKTQHSYYKKGFLYMLAHAHFRNKKFEKSLQYLNQLMEELDGAPKSHVQEFAPKANLLGASISLFKGQVEVSINQLSETKETKDIRNNLNVCLNLSVAYFFNRAFSSANAALRAIPLSDKKCLEYMGLEWGLKKALVELLIYIELESFDLAESKLKSLKRQFAEILTLPTYQRVLLFLDHIGLIKANMSSNERNALLVDLPDVFEEAPANLEDLQAMAFYAWLKSKALGQDAYQVLLGFLK